MFRKGNYELVTSIDGHQLNYQIKVIVDEILENDQYIEENHYDEASSIKVPSFDVDGFDNETILKVVAEDNGVEVKNVTKEMLAQYDMLFFGPENVLQASNLRYYNNLCSKYNVDATAEKVLLVPMDYNFQIDDLKYFPNCEVLYVYNAPEVIDLQNIGKYPKLKTVDIDNSVVENYHALYDLPNLKLLALIGDGIEDISGISKLKDSVELLYLNKNNITNISELSAFSKIKFLNLNENSIEDYTPLYSLTTLQETYTDSTDSNIPGYVKRNPWFGW